MLTSLHSHTDEEEEGAHHRHPNLQILPHGLTAPSTHSCRLLISCAELIHRADYSAARRILSLLSNISSPHGDSTDRLVHQFARSLSLRIDRLTHLISPSLFSDNEDTLQSSYLSLNKVTPFLRFAHLTANQAILEAIDGHRSIHILDFDTSHGVQWPPFLQAIAERSDPSSLPSIRITGTGTGLDVLRRTGERLQAFANSLGLRFQFHPLYLPTADPDASASLNSSFQLHPGETLAVNCMLFLHKLLKDGSSDDPACKLVAFLHAVKAMNPVVVTVAEREANHNSPIFLRRFMEALDHYTAVFESLEATLPPKSPERLEVEQVWLGREIEDIVGREGEGRKERHERFEWWEGLMRGRGFSSLPLSPFALSQAKLLLRLHYPSEGYQLPMSKNSLFLGWQHKPLFSVSSWH
ncbi:scarecrow-like protein 18 [Phoenix dactylifera]|uniref:Scarecrow-like protein 18 n=1 Tax=Phoenix dactylifera TaxID=42345 RepID=A0A8B7D1M5_PHODC|nr:scarecrow-like protein 18 [Phoenix dactylifera]